MTLPHLLQLELKEFHIRSSEYHKMRVLRELVLRKPLGLNLRAEDCLNEDLQRHFGIFDPEGNPLAGLIIVELENGQAQLRQMAVAPNRQGEGMGKRLVLGVEETLKENNIQSIFLKSRVEVEPFYRACGYHSVGEIFTELGIGHIRMEKTIDTETRENSTLSR